MPTINARRFDGVDDVIAFNAPTYFGTTEYTYAAVVKRDVVNAWHGIFSIGGSTGNPYMVFEFGQDTGVADLLEIVHLPGHMYSIGTTHNWAITTPILVAATFDSASDLVRFHAFDGTTWFHHDQDSASGGGGVDPTDWTSDATVQLRFGNWDGSFNYFQGLQFVQALNRTTALSDGEIEDLAGGTKESWAPSFDHLWELNQADVADPITDYIGSLDQTVRVGTAVDTFDLPSTIYQFDGGGGGDPGDDDIFVRVAGDWVPSNKQTRVGGSWV
jgi:hypothetical protein